MMFLEISTGCGTPAQAIFKGSEAIVEGYHMYFLPFLKKKKIYHPYAVLGYFCATAGFPFQCSPPSGVHWCASSNR